MNSSPEPHDAASAPPRPPLLEAVDVHRRFGDVVALNGASVDINHNEFFAILGPSGCGKTTLLRIIAGFEHPDSGRVELDGENLLTQPPNRRPVNLMFQSYALFPHMSVDRNIAYGLEREGLPKAEVRQRVTSVLETVGLTSLAGRRPQQLSGGQRQRVALARAIVKRPKMLLLDEPLSALDKKVRAEMQRELKRLQHEVGITFAVVTHDQEEAMSMADRIAVLHEGAVQQVDDPVTLYRQPANVFVADFIGASNLLSGTCTSAGVGVPGVGELPGHGQLELDQPATLMIRPEHMHVHVLPEHGAVDPDGRTRGPLSGRVIDVQFYGGTSTLAVDVGHGLPPMLATVTGSPPASPGAYVALSWNAEDAVIVSPSPQ